MIVYITTNLINGKKYIGVDTKNNPEYLGSGKYLKLAIKKYGRENFKKEILEECISRDKVFEREKYWINYYKACESKEYYNLAEGGNGGNSWEGKSEEDKFKFKEYISKLNKGRKCSKYTRQKMSLSHIGKHSVDVLSSETLRKKSLSMLGKKQSSQTINRKIEKISRPILQYDLSKNLIKEWFSGAQILRELKIHDVGKNCKKNIDGFNCIYKGYYFKFKNI